VPSPVEDRDDAMHQGRLHYLDALRSFCMLYGVFVHTSAFLGPQAIGLIGPASAYFRMGTFFLVSGFLVALVAARTSVPSVLRKRSVALLVPLATVTVLANPVTCWLIHLRHAGPMSFGEFLLGGGWRTPAGAEASWLLHLWFLISLWVYVMLFPLLARLAAAGPVRRGLDTLGRWPGEAVVPLVGLGVAAAAVALRVVHDLAVEPLVAGTPFAWVAFATVLYLPYFGLGVLMHAGRGLFERMHRASPVALGLGALLLVAAAALPAGLPRAAGTIADIVARAVLTVALVATLLGLARALVPARSRVVTLLIDSIYTVYLLHYLAIYALGLLLLRWLPAGPAYYLTLAPLVIVLLVGFHHRVVARSPLLRLLLNGRPTPVAAALPTG